MNEPLTKEQRRTALNRLREKYDLPYNEVAKRTKSSLSCASNWISARGQERYLIPEQPLKSLVLSIRKNPPPLAPKPPTMTPQESKDLLLSLLKENKITIRAAATITGVSQDMMGSFRRKTRVGVPEKIVKKLQDYVNKNPPTEWHMKKSIYPGRNKRTPEVESMHDEEFRILVNQNNLSHVQISGRVGQSDSAVATWLNKKIPTVINASALNRLKKSLEDNPPTLEEMTRYATRGSRHIAIQKILGQKEIP